VITVVLDRVGARIHVHVLIHDELLARIFFVGVNRNSPPAWLGQAGDAHDVAFTLNVKIVAGLHGVESLERFRRTRFVPYIPKRIVFKTQPPQREGGQPKLACAAQFVEHRDAIEEPDNVTLIGVFVDVLEVRIEGVVIEVEVGIGV